MPRDERKLHQTDAIVDWNRSDARIRGAAEVIADADSEEFGGGYS
jgi:hypothetical protein